MSDTKKYVTVSLKRLESGVYDIKSSDILADGDYLWWENAGVLFKVVWEPVEPSIFSRPKYTSLAICETDIQVKEIIDLKLEVL